MRKRTAFSKTNVRELTVVFYVNSYGLLYSIRVQEVCSANRVWDKSTRVSAATNFSSALQPAAKIFFNFWSRNFSTCKSQLANQMYLREWTNQNSKLNCATDNKRGKVLSGERLVVILLLMVRINWMLLLVKKTLLWFKGYACQRSRELADLMNFVLIVICV